jgi:predicted NBD/HSP70 family sugar kinase
MQAVPVPTVHPTGHPDVPDRRPDTAGAVLRAVLDHGPIARSTVARRTGLSAAAVSRQCAELVASGLVRERPVRAPRSGVGRPHVPIDVDTRRHLVCGVHVALSHWTVVLMDLRGRVVAQRRVPHRDPAPTSVLADVATRTAAFLDEHLPGRRPIGVGVATGGWVDPATGVVVRHAQLGWHEVAVGPVLERALGLPVRVESHSRALARAEQLVGGHRARCRRSLVHLFVGNVVDAAICVGETLLHGPRSAAGDVAHLPVGNGAVLPSVRCACSRTGCVQATVANRAVTAYVAAAGLLPDPVFADVLAELAQGRSWAVDLFRDRARLVGRAVALLLDVLNPEIVVVSDSGLARRPELVSVLRAEVAARSQLCTDPDRTVVAGSFGTGALGVAAGAVLLDEVYARPLWAVNRTGPPAWT